MKRSQVFLAWCVLIPTTLRAQDVRVRLYTTQPPNSLLVKAIDGEVRWRTCPSCADSGVRELSIIGADQSGGADIYLTGRYELRPVSGPIFSAAYPVHLERHEGHVLVTVTMPLEDYVAAVLTAESGDFENAESQKAMAVVARTYAMRFLGQHQKEGFDFCDTTHCQVFGWKSAKASVRSAVNLTAGEVLRYDGKVVAAYYHQNCGGTTAAAKEAWPGVTEVYLTSHADPYCVSRGALTWGSSIRVADLDRALRAAGISAPTGWNTIEIVSRSESGRAELLKLTGGTGNAARISASSFRFAVDRELGWQKIRSTFFEVRSVGEQIVFSGRGAGHGVGLCQGGAEEMARQGKSYREILSFYFPSAQLISAQSSAWQKRASERIELLSTQPDTDATILPMAEKVLKEDEEAIGWRVASRVRLQIYGTLDAYRDTTGQPGWVAASTRAGTIRLQPLNELEKRGIVESTLRHEIFHVLVEAKARAATPLWFREGIVLHLSNPDAMSTDPSAMRDEQVEAVLRNPRNQDEVRKAYAASQSRVAALVQQYDKEAVLGWLSSGIPGNVRGGSGGVTTH